MPQERRLAITSTFAILCSRTSVTTNDAVAFIESSDQDATKIDRPDAVGDFLTTDRVVNEPLATKSTRVLKRNVPALVTRFTRKWPGYSNGGSSPVYERADGT